MLSGSVFGLQLCHGDWFCGKAVGLLVLHLNGMVLNAYVTHVSETSQVQVPGQAAPFCGGKETPLALLPGVRQGIRGWQQGKGHLFCVQLCPVTDAGLI